MTESTVSEVVERLEGLRLFLNGEGWLCGCRFGQLRPDSEAIYWWRKHLSIMEEAATLLSTIKATGGRPSREEVARVLFERYSAPVAPAWAKLSEEAQDQWLHDADAVLSLFSSEGKEDHGLSRDHDPTTCVALELLARLDLSPIALGDGARLLVMRQNPSDNFHWSKPVGAFSAGEVRAALSSQTQVAGESSRDVPKKPASQPDHAPGEGARPIHEAPRDETMLRLLVVYDDHDEHANPLNDEAWDTPEGEWTIGFNAHDLTDEDEWTICGFWMDQDTFANGKGRVIGWLPYEAALPQPQTEGGAA